MIVNNFNIDFSVSGNTACEMDSVGRATGLSGWRYQLRGGLTPLVLQTNIVNKILCAKSHRCLWADVLPDR
ncbi:hypothetical protein [Paraburkholderia sp. BCC1885]|uniref:hypothetical protein n=1 Tax=Paraburkholderia sp. BCC1885 TaxID=2562669 RepID=UPI001183C9CB|nr:hypothetical protein [Paraburkholderia sp. BCC1885]